MNLEDEIMRQKLFIIGTVLSFSLIVAAPVWAECVQENLDGTWNVVVWTSTSPKTQCWDKCTLAINGDGKIVKGKYVKCSGAKSTITGGQLNVSPDCNIDGFINLSNGVLDISLGGIMGNEIVLTTRESEVQWAEFRSWE